MVYFHNNLFSAHNLQKVNCIINFLIEFFKNSGRILWSFAFDDRKSRFLSAGKMSSEFIKNFCWREARWPQNTWGILIGIPGENAADWTNFFSWQDFIRIHQEFVMEKSQMNSESFRNSDQNSSRKSSWLQLHSYLADKMSLEFFKNPRGKHMTTAESFRNSDQNSNRKSSWLYEYILLTHNQMQRCISIIISFLYINSGFN